MTLEQFLVWLIGGGAIIAFSWIMEQIDWFQTLSPKAKRWLMFAGSAAIGLGALAVVTYVPPEVLAQLSPWFTIVAAVFVSVFLNQAAHKYDPDA